MFSCARLGGSVHSSLSSLRHLQDACRGLELDRRDGSLHRQDGYLRSFPDAARCLRPFAREPRLSGARNLECERNPRLRRSRAQGVRFRLADGRAGLGQGRNEQDAPADACHRPARARRASRQRSVGRLHSHSGNAQRVSGPVRNPRRRLRRSAGRWQAAVGVAPGSSDRRVSRTLHGDRRLADAGAPRLVSIAPNRSSAGRRAADPPD